ncbi:MAG: EFR1 family ferrodoxin [Tissierellia bacterium]|nr:EFR1 family ferrodoxin [Tissierellia bacterium]
MRIQNADLFVFSPTGSTLKLSRAFIKKFEGYRINDLTTKKAPRDYMAEEDSLAVFAFPVYAGRVPEIFVKRIKNIHSNRAHAVIIGVYGNRAFDDSLLEMKDILEEKNFNVVAASAFLAQHSYTDKVAGGRPDNIDMEIMEDFSEDIVDLLQNTDADAGFQLDLPGNRPYRQGIGKSEDAPYPGEGCISCGVCAMVCPVHIIEADGKMPEKNIPYCLHCLACVKRCPMQVRVIHSDSIDGFKKYLIDNFSEIYKKPDLFIGKVLNS